MSVQSLSVSVILPNYYVLWKRYTPFRHGLLKSARSWSLVSFRRYTVVLHFAVSCNEAQVDKREAM